MRLELLLFPHPVNFLAEEGIILEHSVQAELGYMDVVGNCRFYVFYLF